MDLNSKEIRVLMVITGLRLGGAEMQCLMLVKHLTKRNIPVGVIAMESGGEMVRHFVSSGAEVYELGISGSISALLSLRKLISSIKEFRPTIIHSHMIHANLYSRLTSLLVSMPPIISTAHSINEGGSLAMAMYRLTDKLSRRSGNVSKEALQHYVEQKFISPSRAFCIPNAIDTSKFVFSEAMRNFTRYELGLKEDDFLFLAVGRLHYMKDYPTMLYAFRKFLDRNCNQAALLYIVGEGPEEAELRQLCDELRLNDYLRFLGKRTEIAKLMCAADTFVLSSSQEGFGLVVAEAMSCTLPVIATDAGGVREVMGGFGELIAVGNQDQISYSMQKAVLRGNLRNTEGRRHIIAHYDISNVIEEWISLYQQQGNAV